MTTPPYPAAYLAPQFSTVPPPRWPRLVLMLVATVAVVVVVGGGLAFAAGYASGSTPPPAPVPVAVAARPPVTSLASGDGQTLRTYLLRPPTHVTPETVRDSTFGVQTLIQFAHTNFSNPVDETARLTGQGFAVSAETIWPDPELGLVTIMLMQFHDPNGATSYALGQISFFTSTTPTYTKYPLAGVVEGQRFAGTLDADSKQRTLLIGQYGPVVVSVDINSGGAVDGSAAAALFLRQYAALAS